jgi:hypothetical protein
MTRSRWIYDNERVGGDKMHHFRALTRLELASWAEKPLTTISTLVCHARRDNALDIVFVDTTQADFAKLRRGKTRDDKFGFSK